MKSEKQINRFQELLAKALKEAREESGISKTELEHRTGISRQGIRLIEENERSPSVVTLWQLADGLNIPLTKLVEQLPK